MKGKDGGMPSFVGQQRNEILDYLVDRYDVAAQKGEPSVVTLEAPMGMGKTRIVQEFYERLAGSRQSAPPYWPPTVHAGTATAALLHERKRIVPERFQVSGGASLPWFWWAVH